MSDENEKIKVTDRRIKFDDEGPGTGEKAAPQEGQARKMERKKAAEDYKRASAREDTPLPRVDFATFVLSLSSSVLMHLGEIADHETGENRVNLPMARHTIDILAMLEEKTRGNLSPEEERMLKDFLFEVRMKYVQKAS